MISKYLLCLFLQIPAFQLLAGEDHTIYLASISWHTGIIVPAYSLPDSIWPENHEFSKDVYLEIGWGDRDYFQHPTFNLWFAFKAVFWPTPTALHILPLMERHVPGYYKNTKLVKLKVTGEELNNLSDFLISQFEFNEAGEVIPLKEGFYYNSQFFAGRTKYYFPKNSNVWAAVALKKAGFKFVPIFYQTTKMVVNRAGNFGEIIVE